MVVDQSPEGSSAARLLDLRCRGQLEAAGRERRRRLPRHRHALELRRHPGAAQEPRRRRRHQRHERRRPAEEGRGSYSFENGHLLLWTRWDNLEDRPLMEQRDRLVKEFGAAKRRLDDRQLAQPVPVPERVPDGPVQLADPRVPPARRQPHRSHHLRIAPSGRIGRGACPPHPPVRGLLQRPGMATPDDSKSSAPARNGPCAGVERHVARRYALGRRPGRRSRTRSTSSPSCRA